MLKFRIIKLPLTCSNNDLGKFPSAMGAVTSKLSLLVPITAAAVQNVLKLRQM